LPEQTVPLARPEPDPDPDPLFNGQVKGAGIPEKRNLQVQVFPVGQVIKEEVQAAQVAHIF
jgi:hypothetical protein